MRRIPATDAIGMMPGSGGSVRVARIAGLTRAKDMVMLGKRLPADQAKEKAYELALQAVKSGAVTSSGH